MSTKVEKYGTTQLFYDDGKFTATVGGEELTAPSVQALKKKIDKARIGVVKTAFEPFTALYYVEGYYGASRRYGTDRKPEIIELKIVDVRILKPRKTHYGRDAEKKYWVLDKRYDHVGQEISSTDYRLFPTSARATLAEYAGAEAAEGKRHTEAQEVLGKRWRAIVRHDGMKGVE